MSKGTARNFLIVVVVAGALFYFFFFPSTSETVTNKPINKNDEVQSPVIELGKAQPETEAISEPVKAPKTLSPEQQATANSVISELSNTSGGLSEAATNNALALRDFDALIYQLDSSQADYKFQQEFSSAIRISTENNNDVITRNFGCNKTICAATFDYSEQTAADDFSNQLIEQLQQPVAITIQPAVVNGVKELRLILNYKTAGIAVEGGR